MALDKQKILGELGSVMKQLQSADCGCLGKLFGNSQQANPSMGNPVPTCGGCRRACSYGHGCYNGSFTSPNQNMYSMPIDGSNPSQQPMSGNMFGFGPQIVNMMRGNQSRSRNMPVQGQGQPLDPARGLTDPMIIDAPQSPHGKVGLTPFTPPAQGQFNPAYETQGDIPVHMQNQFTGQAKNQFTTQTVSNTTGNIPNNNLSTWPQQNLANPTAWQMPTSHTSQHGQHSQGIAKFNQMFPGVKQGGDLGFDPMAIAIQMNPDNHLQSAMDTMHKIMNDKGGNNMLHPAVQQPGIGGNSNIPQNAQIPNNTTQHNPLPVSQGNVNQIPNQQMPDRQNVTDPNQLLPIPQNTARTYGQPIPPQHQQIYPAAVNPTSVDQQALQYGESQQTARQQQQYQQPQKYEQQKIDINSGAPNLPVMYEESPEDQTQLTPAQEIVYSNEPLAHQMIKEPIFPADMSRTMYVPAKHQKKYGYNTLGQPVEILPAKMYHPPEPSLPQTLSPQPISVKSKNNALKAVSVKATVSKTSLMGKKPVGGIPSRSQLQHIYNQYKGSQSFTQQNVRHPGDGTYSAGKLNVPPANASKAPAIPVERVGGDTVANNLPINQVQSNKVEQVMGHIGDVLAPKSAGDSVPVKEAPAPIKKCRNGLQDMVFSSYPTSAAWTFHGHGRDELAPTYRYRNRHY